MMVAFTVDTFDTTVAWDALEWEMYSFSTQILYFMKIAIKILIVFLQ